MPATKKEKKITASQISVGQKVTIRHGGKEVTGEVLEIDGDRFCFTSTETGAFWMPVSVITKLG